MGVSRVPQVTTQEEGTAGELTEGGSDRSSRRCTFLDLVLALSPGLDAASLGMVERVVLPAIAETDAAVQKKAYKLLAHLSVAQPGFVQENMSKLVKALADALPACAPSSRRNRLKCVGNVIPLLDLTNVRDGARCATPVIEHLGVGARRTHV